MTRPHIIVVGGGIVGTAAAAFLAEGGARVTLVEATGLASGASGANSGVVQHPLDAALGPLYEQTVGLYRDLALAAVGFTLPLTPAGLLYVGPDAAAAAFARSVADRFPALRPEVIVGPAVARLEPHLRPGIAACIVETGYPVPPASATYAYATQAERLGVTIRLGRRARLTLDRGRAVGVTLGRLGLGADAVLVAAGPGSSACLRSAGARVPIHPVWGVVVEAALAPRPRHVLEELGLDAAIGALSTESAPRRPQRAAFSLVPSEITSAVGSTFLTGRPDPRTWTERLIQRGARFVPDLLDAPIRSWRACARPQSSDGRPLVGAVPSVPGLYVCAGHGAWGISTGPASARLIADHILGRLVTIPLALAPERFLPPTDPLEGAVAVTPH